MYDILFAPISKRHSEEIAYDWAIMESYIRDLPEATRLIARAVAKDLEDNDPFAYRIVERGTW